MQTNNLIKVINEFDSELVNNMAKIMINDICIRINYVENSNNFTLLAAIDILNNQNISLVLKWIANINLLGKKTNGGHIGLDELSNIIVFSQIINIEMLSTDEIKNLIEKFALTHHYLFNQYKESFALDNIEQANNDFLLMNFV